MSVQTLPTLYQNATFVSAASNVSSTSPVIDTSEMKELMIVVDIINTTTPAGNIAIQGSADNVLFIPLKMQSIQVNGSGFSTFTNLDALVTYTGSVDLQLLLGFGGFVGILPLYLKVVNTRTSGGSATVGKYTVAYFGKS